MYLRTIEVVVAVTLLLKKVNISFQQQIKSMAFLYKMSSKGSTEFVGMKIW